MIDTYEVKEKIRRQEATLRARANLDALVTDLRKLGHAVKLGARGAQTGIEEIDGIFQPVVFEPERNYARRPTGKVRLKVGGYGDAKNYPEPKDGFDSDKTLERVLESFQAAKAKHEVSAASDEHRRMRRANLDVVATLLDYGLHDADEFKIFPAMKARINDAKGDPNLVVVEIALSPLEAADLIRDRLKAAEKSCQK